MNNLGSCAYEGNYLKKLWRLQVFLGVFFVCFHGFLQTWWSRISFKDYPRWCNRKSLWDGFAVFPISSLLSAMWFLSWSTLLSSRGHNNCPGVSDQSASWSTLIFHESTLSSMWCWPKTNYEIMPRSIVRNRRYREAHWLYKFLSDDSRSWKHPKTLQIPQKKMPQKMLQSHRWLLGCKD